MVEGEATQEPTAPEGALASPPAAELAPEPAVEPAGSVETAAGSIDWSHVRGFQTVEPATEALATRDDYGVELAKEFAVRAARFARSVDESIVLSSDGVLRWLGDPVARLAAGEQLLQPRAVLLADEALAGEDRIAVENRVTLWLGAHLRKVLGPLLALVEGTELPEAAKALGGKIAEALGVLERERVREDVRALDQTARGALRKLGVRFGSLYIYAPALLKPGARGLCTLLWSIKRGAEAEAGAERLQAFAAAGRTSFANEGLLSPDAYRVSGFRLSGERVVRVDIIERLTDLIRGAIPDHMRGGSRPTSPTYGFLVNSQMTSLTGCSGEAFASILRSLGFEPVKVSKAAFEAARVKAPTEPLKPATEAMAEAEAASDGSGVAEAAAGTEVASADTEPLDGLAIEAASGTLEAPTDAIAAAEAEAETSEEPAVSQVAFEAESSAESSEEPAVAQEPAEAEIASQEDALTVAASGEETVAAELAAAADEEIEIWRPTPRRPRQSRPQQAGEHDAKAQRGRGHRRHGRPAEEASPDGAETRPQAAPRPPRRDEAPRRAEAKDERRDDRRPQKPLSPRRESRPQQIDPDSPFAKLAALKPLLERRDKRP